MQEDPNYFHLANQSSDNNSIKIFFSFNYVKIVHFSLV